MELERVISCLQTLNKLRSGPLGTHLDGFCAWLLRRGFSRQTIRMHLSNVSHFNEHLVRQRSVTGQLLCATDVAEFFAAYPSWCRRCGHLRAHLLRVRHSVSRFVVVITEN